VFYTSTTGKTNCAKASHQPAVADIVESVCQVCPTNPGTIDVNRRNAECDGTKSNMTISHTLKGVATGYELLDKDGNVIRKKIEAKQDTYIFDDLVPGEYMIRTYFTSTTGKPNCTADSTVLKMVAPSCDELCDGIDNDYDGEIDNSDDCECIHGKTEKCGEEG